MLGIHVKRSITSTFERVIAATNNVANSIRFEWRGNTAGIKINKGHLTVFFPAIDEGADISKKLFNDLVGYALHEIGHGWFTDNDAWDEAVKTHGKELHRLINGLEDPRIERAVITCGYAPNAQNLFESLVNNILNDGGYDIKPDDIVNIGFICAIEGRRLNGYPIPFDECITRHYFSTAIREAVTAAHTAKNTREIIRIAITLFDAIKNGAKGKPDDTQSKPCEDGSPDDSKDEADTSTEDGKPNGNDGDDGNDSDDADADGAGSGKGSYDERPIEPDQHIIDQLKSEAPTDVVDLPIRRKIVKHFVGGKHVNRY